MVDLEELWGERQPQNRPGTGPEASNWRRRASHTLEEAQKDVETVEFLRELDALRPGPAERPRGRPSDEPRPDEQAPKRSSHGISDDDIYLFNEGTHRRLGEKLGAHPLPGGGVAFAVWAPNAVRVAVMGDFNYWSPEADPLEMRAASGIWEGTVAHAASGTRVQVRHHDPRWCRSREGRSVRPLHGESAAHRVGRVGSGLRMG